VIPHPHTRYEMLHTRSGSTLAEIILGASDGLTVPFALAAGLSGAVASGWLVFMAGAAEMLAGAVAMGMGGYLSSRSERDLYYRELARERREVEEVPAQERAEVEEIYREKGLAGEPLRLVVDAITSDKARWVETMMREELNLEQPSRPPLTTGLTIGLSYMAGAFVPLAPYLVAPTVRAALVVSTIVTIVALVLAGAVKSRFTGEGPVRSAIETAVIGAIAGGAAFGFVRLLATAVEGR
jgi:VIT1/CCC1 family predicted Fe2+/Mn2+ transporter